jgi:hypothetical protein
MKKSAGFNTPILLLTFNRPNTTQRVFNEIKKIKPKKLFIASDGPRRENKEDEANCQKTRKIIEQINWPCEVKTLFRNENLGGPVGNSSAITWFFENVEQGIILEDDCLPHQSFFQYCEELLEKYRNNDKIMCISGDNFQNGIKRDSASYYFSNHNHCWGWASWRRAWSLRNKDFKKNYEYFIKENKIEQITKNKLYQKFWLNIFKKIYTGEKNNWDFIWTFTCWSNGGLTCLPNKNLVSNIGFGPNAQHTTDKNSKLSNMRTEILDFPLTHPALVKANEEADDYTNKHHFKIKKQKFSVLFLNILKKALKKLKLFNITKKLYTKLK